MTDQQPETPAEPTPEERAAIQTDPPAATPPADENPDTPNVGDTAAHDAATEPAPAETPQPGVDTLEDGGGSRAELNPEEPAPGEPTGSDGSPADSRGLSEEQSPNPAAPPEDLDDEDFEDEGSIDEGDNVDTTVSGATAPGGAVMENADGVPVQHGEPTPGLGITPGEEEPRQPLPEQGVFEPDPVEIDRPDIGTTVEVTEVEVIVEEVEEEPEPPTV